MVFVGRVLQVEDSGVLEFKSDSHNLLRVRFEVTESLQGAKVKQLEVLTSPSSCGFRFVPGGEYLVHAGRQGEKPELWTGACSGNGHAGEMKDVIDQLRAHVKQEGPASIYGFATLDPSDMSLQLRASQPVKGAPVRLRNGDQEWRTVTDANGNYEFRDLPPGDFALHASVDGPKAQRQIKLNAGACSEQNFLGAQVAHIAGRLLDSEGKPVPRAKIDIEAVAPARPPRPLLVPTTGDDGRFTYPNLLPGRYRLGVNLESPPHLRFPVGPRMIAVRAYYPSEVVIEQGKNVDGLEFRLPPLPAVRPIQGRIVDSAGRPVRASVGLFDLEYTREHSQVDAVATGDDGVFRLEGVAGRRYTVFALADGPGDREVRTATPVVLEPHGPDGPMVLRLSAPSLFDLCALCERFPVYPIRARP